MKKTYEKSNHTKLDRVKTFRDKVAKRYQSNYANLGSTKKYIINLLNLLSDEETHKGMRNRNDFKWIMGEITLWRSIATHKYGLMPHVDDPSLDIYNCTVLGSRLND